MAMGDFKLPDELSSESPVCEVVRFREIGWFRDNLALIMLYQKIQDFWVSKTSTECSGMNARSNCPSLFGRRESYATLDETETISGEITIKNVVEGYIDMQKKEKALQLFSRIGEIDDHGKTIPNTVDASFTDPSNEKMVFRAQQICNTYSEVKYSRQYELDYRSSLDVMIRQTPYRRRHFSRCLSRGGSEPGSLSSGFVEEMYDPEEKVEIPIISVTLCETSKSSSRREESPEILSSTSLDTINLSMNEMQESSQDDCNADLEMHWSPPDSVIDTAKYDPTKMHTETNNKIQVTKGPRAQNVSDRSSFDLSKESKIRNNLSFSGLFSNEKQVESHSDEHHSKNSNTICRRKVKGSGTPETVVCAKISSELSKMLNETDDSVMPTNISIDDDKNMFGGIRQLVSCYDEEINKTSEPFSQENNYISPENKKKYKSGYEEDVKEYSNSSTYSDNMTITSNDFRSLPIHARAAENHKSPSKSNKMQAESLHQKTLHFKGPSENSVNATSSYYSDWTEMNILSNYGTPTVSMNSGKISLEKSAELKNVNELEEEDTISIHDKSFFITEKQDTADYKTNLFYPKPSNKSDVRSKQNYLDEVSGKECEMEYSPSIHTYFSRKKDTPFIRGKLDFSTDKTPDTIRVSLDDENVGIDHEHSSLSDGKFISEERDIPLADTRIYSEATLFLREAQSSPKSVSPSASVVQNISELSKTENMIETLDNEAKHATVNEIDASLLNEEDKSQLHSVGRTLNESGLSDSPISEMLGIIPEKNILHENSLSPDTETLDQLCKKQMIKSSLKLLGSEPSPNNVIEDMSWESKENSKVEEIQNNGMDTNQSQLYSQNASSIQSKYKLVNMAKPKELRHINCTNNSLDLNPGIQSPCATFLSSSREQDMSSSPCGYRALTANSNENEFNSSEDSTLSSVSEMSTIKRTVEAKKPLVKPRQKSLHSSLLSNSEGREMHHNEQTCDSSHEEIQKKDFSLNELDEAVPKKHEELGKLYEILYQDASNRSFGVRGESILMSHSDVHYEVGEYLRNMETSHDGIPSCNADGEYFKKTSSKREDTQQWRIFKEQCIGTSHYDPCSDWHSDIDTPQTFEDGIKNEIFPETRQYSWQMENILQNLEAQKNLCGSHTENYPDLVSALRLVKEGIITTESALFEISSKLGDIITQIHKED